MAVPYVLGVLQSLECSCFLDIMDPDETAAVVSKLIQGYREHAAAEAASAAAEDQASEDLEDDPDCE